MKLFTKALVAASFLLLGSACGKKDPQPTKPTEATATATAQPTKPTEPTAAADAGAKVEEDTAPAMAEDTAKAPEEVAAAAEDVAEATETKPYLKVTVNHHDTAKPPVTGEFQFKVVEAHTDLSKPETAKAVLEVDLASFSSGIDDRDNHVKSNDFLDVATSPKATVTIAGVKAGAAADSYDATATLELRGVKKDVPVTFKVVEKKEDGTLVIEGEAKGLARADWNMTAPEEKVNVGPTFDVALRAELKETAAGGGEIAPAAGTPEEIFAKMTTHQEKVLDLIEANKANPDAAAEAIEKYAAEHKAELAPLAMAMSKLTPEQMEGILKGNEAKLKSIMERGQKLMTENPGLEANERFKKAMESLSSGGN